jgi:hypothetical protein
MFSSADDARTGTPRARDRDTLAYLEPGSRSWGGIEITDAVAAHRSGFLRYRLEVFAPGTNEAERRDLRFFRRVRVWAAVAALAAEMIVGAALPGAIGILAIAGSYLFVVAYWLHRTSRVRRSIRRASIAVVLRGEPGDVIGDFDLFADCVDSLRELDVLAAAGAVTPAEHELSWSRVYARLAPSENPAHAK